MQILRCENVCKRFGGNIALDDLSVRFPPSGIVAIIGPNGAGKTTLLNVLTGFVEPDSGDCLFGESAITRMPAHKIARLGIVRTFQELRIVRQESVLENIMLRFPRQRGEKFFGALLRFGVAAEESRNKGEAMRILSSVELEHKANDPSGELSYGEEKLLSLASCLAADARLNFFDEPIAGVHVAVRKQIVKLFKGMKNEGKLVIFIEHDIAFVREIAESLIVMDNGRIVAHGTPSEILNRRDILEAYIG